MKKIIILITLLCSLNIAQDCDENMLLDDCDCLSFCNNEPGFGFDCYVYNEYCEDFNGDGITDSWVGDGWCDDGEWGYDFQCTHNNQNQIQVHYYKKTAHHNQTLTYFLHNPVLGI